MAVAKPMESNVIEISHSLDYLTYLIGLATGAPYTLAGSYFLTAGALAGARAAALAAGCLAPLAGLAADVTIKRIHNTTLFR